MSTATPTVIVVEDEAKIRRFIKLALEAEQLEVFEADSVARGLIEVGTRQPDLVVLDLGLPDGDGIDLIRDVRTWSDIPIIVLSARTAEADKVAALDAGADDYLIKPFGAAELLARVRAHLRRRFRAGTTGMTVCEFGNVRVDLGKHIVEKDGHPFQQCAYRDRREHCRIRRPPRQSFRPGNAASDGARTRASSSAAPNSLAQVIIGTSIECRHLVGFGRAGGIQR